MYRMVNLDLPDQRNEQLVQGEIQNTVCIFSQIIPILVSCKYSNKLMTVFKGIEFSRCLSDSDQAKRKRGLHHIPNSPM